MGRVPVMAMQGIQAVFAERKRRSGDMALVLFDVLHLDGKSVMREHWRDRRKRLEDLLEDHQLPRTTSLQIARSSVTREPVMLLFHLRDGPKGIEVADWLAIT